MTAIEAEQRTLRQALPNRLEIRRCDRPADGLNRITRSFYLNCFLSRKVAASRPNSEAPD